MKKYNKKDIYARYLGNKILIKAYYGFKLIWQSISSCFGSGYWVNDKPWINDEPFKN